ncbi:MAG: 3-methyl-2-oxobutanoate hydroxymethyltransferase [Alphaproteobacteria bacterium]|nr:3-methyl-2-oxobutanoate hydroxymethyltransferase [Alphaproteobacteria bacterium]
MSIHTPPPVKKLPFLKLTVQDIRAAKNRTEPFLALTAYTAPIAQLADKHADVVLVGDSLGMVLYGMTDTLGVTLEMMMTHGRCVAQFCQRALCVVDMPFGTYQASHAQAFENCARLMKKTGAGAVKLEGGAEMASTIRFLVERGIPVMGHIGLRPQQVHVMGGYKVQGKTDDQIALLKKDAQAIEEAGAFAVVIEGTLEHVSREITQSITIPTIGIGASPACDAQILVTEDVLGLVPGAKAKFVKPYANLYQTADDAIQQLSADVKARRFPGPENLYIKTTPLKTK